MKRGLQQRMGVSRLAFKNLSYDEMKKRLRECADFLISKKRVVPAQCFYQSKPLPDDADRIAEAEANRRWLKWIKKEHEAIKKAALKFDDNYFWRYKKFAEIKGVKSIRSGRVSSIALLNYFLFVGTGICHDARTTRLLAETCENYPHKPELYEVADLYAELLMLICQKAADYNIQFCAFWHIYDSAVLYDLAHRRGGGRFKKIAEFRTWYLSRGHEVEIRNDLANMFGRKVYVIARSKKRPT